MPVSDPQIVHWDSEQLTNAQIIIRVGRQLGASDRDIQIALMTAMQESSLRNLFGGDRDSVGLFQQRDAWGSFSQRHNPEAAAKMFFLGGHQGQPGLFDIDNRDALALGEVAQAVQRSAYPDRYAQHERFAAQLAARFGGQARQQVSIDQPAVVPEQPERDLGSSVASPAGIESPVSAGVEGYDTPEPYDEVTHLPQLDRAAFTSYFPHGTLMGGSKRSKLVNEAMSWLGIPYVWGGNSRNGVDCSGLVQQVFARFNIDLPRVSYQQAGAGTRIPLARLQPGDLVAWDRNARNSGADHIAIYAGDGWIIEAPRTGLNVRRRRLLPDEDAFGVAMSY